MIKLTPQAHTAVNKLQSASFEAFIVGGYVRDCLMGKEPYDTDITTNALPDETKKVFYGFKVIDTGIKHGTVSVIIDKIPVEITTYRTETTYSDNRHPDSVSFAKTLTEDLSRRDFTVNAIAYSPDKGLIDPYGGAEDIKNKTIKCVGDADIRFKEDALRILRALRFASKLGFDIEEHTSEAMFANKKLLSNVSRERISDELNKIICGENAQKVLYDYAEIIFEIIPQLAAEYGFEQHNPHHDLDVYRHSLMVMSLSEPKVHLRLAALLHDIAKPHCAVFDEAGICHFKGHDKIGADMADAILRELKYDNATREAVVTLIKYHMYPLVNTEKSVKKLLNKIGEEAFFDVLAHKRADMSGKPASLDNSIAVLDGAGTTAHDIIAKKECFSLKELAVNGNDIINIGLSGERIGKTLDLLLSAVIDGEIPNEKQALIAEAEKFKNNLQK